MILRYPGSKEKAARDLLSLAPKYYAEYREPFCGNASMLWVVPTDVKRWVNDADADIYRFLLFLQNGDVDVFNRIRERLMGADVDTYQRDFDLAKLAWVLDDDQSARWLLSRLSYGQNVDRNRHDIASFGYHHMRNGIQACTPARVAQAREIMKNVKITNHDYSVLLDAPGDDVFLMIDPPYLICDHGRPLYPLDMDYKQHCELAERLRVCRHKFLLTIGYCGLTQDLYMNDRFNWTFRSYTYEARNKEHRQEVAELIVMNY